MVYRLSGRIAVAFVAGAITLTLLITASRGAASGDSADLVFGQAGSFTTATMNKGGLSAGGLANPLGVAVDANGNVYIADDVNNRVLQYDNPMATDTIADRVFGQPNFTSSEANNGGVSASSLNLPTGIALDTAGNLYVADYSNNRVLEYDSPLSTDTVADRVFGQPDFVSRRANNGGVSASSLFWPVGVAVDSSGNVYIGDYYNHRVLEYDTPLSGDTVADRVFGQGGDFTSRICNLGGTTPSSLCFFGGGLVETDSAGNLYVADAINNRVLVYNNPILNDTAADLVFGQGGDLTTRDANKGGISASSLFHPEGIAVDSGGNVYISDTNNNRVLKYTTPLTTDLVADQVFGQHGSFTTKLANNGGISASSLYAPRIGLDVGPGGIVYIGDGINNRILAYTSSGGQQGTPTASPTASPTSPPTPSPTLAPTPSPTPGSTASPTPSPTQAPPQVPSECSGMSFDTMIIGTSSDDGIVGTQGRDLIFGLGGNDSITGQNGNDCIAGGDGDDFLSGDGNDDVIVGGDGNDYAAGGVGNDWIWGGPGNDFLRGLAGTDWCDGGIDVRDTASTCENVSNVP